jgi:hypothetical protein
MKKLLASIGVMCLASAAGASPAVVAHSACPQYAVDIEVFATCEGDRVAMPGDMRLGGDMLLATATWSAWWTATKATSARRASVHSMDGRTRACHGLLEPMPP